MALFDKINKKNKVLQPKIVDEYQRELSEEELKIIEHDEKPVESMSPEEKKYKFIEGLFKDTLEAQRAMGQAYYEIEYPEEEIIEEDNDLEQLQNEIINEINVNRITDPNDKNFVGPIFQKEDEDEEDSDYVDIPHEIIRIYVNDDTIHKIINLDEEKKIEIDHDIIYIN